MNNPNRALNLKFIETYLRDGANSDQYTDLKHQLYHTGYSRSQVISLLVEGELYRTIDNFYRRHPSMQTLN